MRPRASCPSPSPKPDPRPPGARTLDACRWPNRNDAAIDDRDQLLKKLGAAGLTEKDLERAAEDGRLPTLAVEVALGGKGAHSMSEVAKASGLSSQFLRRLLQAVGRPNPRPRERILSDEDIEIAKLVRSFLDAGLPRDGVLEVGRVMSQGLSPVAESIRLLVGNAYMKPRDSEDRLAVRYAEAAEELAPLVGPMLAYQLRVHLRDGMRRDLVTSSDRQSGELVSTEEVAIAFADLVDYTSLGERLAPEDVGRIAGRLGARAS